MAHFLRRVTPVIAICFATLLAGCVVVPERRGYAPAVYVPGPAWGWGHHRH